MLIKKLVLNNFLSHKQTEIEFDNNLTLLSGNNGAGKSAILDAILLLLFKRARMVDARGSNVSELISDNAVSMNIAMDFILNGKDYCVKAQKKENSPIMHNLFESGKLVIGKSSDTVEYIQSILNMDYDTFIASVFLVQGDSDFFLSSKSNERKKIFSRVLGLNIYEALEKLAKLERRDWTQKHENLIAVINSKEEEVKQIKRELQGYDSLNSIIDEVRQLKKIYQDSCSTCAMLSKEIESTRSFQIVHSELQAIQNKIRDIKQVVHNAFSKLKQIEDIKDTSELITKRDSLNKELDKLDREYNELSAKKERLFALRQNFLKTTDQITKLEDQCPLCLSEISSEKKIELLNEFKAKIKKADELGSTLEKKIQEKYDCIEVNSKNKNEYTIQIDQQVAARNNKETQRTLANTLARQLKEFEEKEIKLIGERKQSQELEQKRVWYEKELKKQKEFESKLEEQTKLLSRLEELKKRALDIDLDLAVQKSTAKSMAQETIYYDKIAKASNEQGIPTTLINLVLPEFNEEANRILQLLTKGQFLLDFSLDNEKKAMNCNVKLRNGINRLYELCSGGERFKIDLAVRLALSLVLSKRSGTKIDTVFIDEGAGCLDNESREFFIDLLNYAKTKFKRVLVITHIDELKERFRNVIEFTKVKGISKVQCS